MSMAKGGGALHVLGASPALPFTERPSLKTAVIGLAQALSKVCLSAGGSGTVPHYKLQRSN